jgi:GNAT superfamily N-acetyltransferase
MMDESFLLRVTPEPDESERAFVLQNLIAYNDAHSAALQASRGPDNGRRPLHVMLYDAQQQMLGGIIGYTIWNWLDIDLFWLDASVRRHGYGSQMIRQAEAEAQRRGCQHSKVGTYSFQARGFYEKMGYRVVGQIDDFPPGATDYTLVKDLTKA